MSLPKTGLLKTSKSFKQKTNDEKSVEFNPKISTLNTKGEEKIEVKPEKTKKNSFTISETFSPIDKKANLSSFKTLNLNKINNKLNEEEKSNESENSQKENENVFVNQEYFKNLKKSPNENWAKKFRNLKIFSFFLGQINYHNNNFSHYCSICSLKKPIKKKTIICEDCFNSLILFELTLRKMDDECIDFFISNKKIFKLESINKDKINLFRDFVYKEFSFLLKDIDVDNLGFEDENENENESESESDDDFLNEQNEENVDSPRSNKLLINYKKIDLFNDEEEKISIHESESELQSYKISNINLMNNNNSKEEKNEIKESSEDNLCIAIRFIKRCSLCKRVRENAFFKFNREKNTFECIYCFIKKSKEYFVEGKMYETITRSILTGLTFHKEKDLF